MRISSKISYVFGITNIYSTAHRRVRDSLRGRRADGSGRNASSSAASYSQVAVDKLQMRVPQSRSKLQGMHA